MAVADDVAVGCLDRLRRLREAEARAQRGENVLLELGARHLDRRLDRELGELRHRAEIQRREAILARVEDPERGRFSVRGPR